MQVAKNRKHGKKGSRRRVHLSDHEVELMRVLHEEFPRGHPQHLGHLRLARKFGVSKEVARSLCRYIYRAFRSA